MKIVDLSVLESINTNTKTVEHFSKVLGRKSINIVQTLSEYKSPEGFSEALDKLFKYREMYIEPNKKSVDECRDMILEPMVGEFIICTEHKTINTDGESTEVIIIHTTHNEYHLKHKVDYGEEIAPIKIKGNLNDLNGQYITGVTYAERYSDGNKSKYELTSMIAIRTEQGSAEFTWVCGSPDSHHYDLYSGVYLQVDEKYIRDYIGKYNVHEVLKENGESNIHVLNEFIEFN